METKRLLLLMTVALAAGLASSGIGAQTRGTAPQSAVSAAPAGDAKRGKTLFEQTYRCYACHGYDGQTGTPRLVPMSRTEDAFMTYVRKPATAAMPAFADVPAQDLGDVYAYIRSIRAESPSVETVPILRDILQQITKDR